MGAFSLIVVINLLNRVMMSLEDCLVEECPSTVYYIRNFITEEQEQELVRNINGAPKPKWVQLSNRRLQNWGGIPHAKVGKKKKCVLYIILVHFVFFSGK